MAGYVIIYVAGIVVTLFAAFAGYVLVGKSDVTYLTRRSSYIYPVLILSIFYVVIFSIMKDQTILSHHSYLDFAVFLDYFNNFVSGKGLFSTIQENAIPGSGHWFSAHFTPITYLFCFFFWIWPSFHTINWLQTILLASSAPILYLMAKPRIGTFNAMCLSVVLLFNPTFQYITLYEFEYLRFLIPLGILVLGIILKTDSSVAILIACLSVFLIREDATFFIFGIGLYLFVLQKKRALGASVMLAAIIYLAVVLKFVMPYFRGAANYVHVAAGSFEAFGTTLPEIIKNIMLHPIQLFIYIFHPYKSVNYLMYLLPLSFVPLWGGRILLIALPSFLLLAISSSYTHSSYFLYYISPIFVVSIWAAVEGIPNLSLWINENKCVTKILKFFGEATKERVALSALCGAIACSIYFGPSPFSIQFWNKKFSLAPFRTTTFYQTRYQPTPHDAVMSKVAGLIPTDSSVSTEQVLLRDVYRTRSIYVFPNIDKADYILIDKMNPRKAYISDNPQYHYDKLEKHPEFFELLYAEDGVNLYKRKHIKSANPQYYL